MPDRFLRKVVAWFALPPAGEYGVGLVFLPRAPSTRATGSRRSSSRSSPKKGSTLLGWRDVPTDDRDVGPSAVAVEPVIEQVFIAPRSAACPAPTRASRFERKLYVIRKRFEHAIDALDIPADAKQCVYIVSLSCNTLIYKGMLTADQIAADVPGSGRPRHGVGARAGAPALQHQHLPVVAAGASVPLRRAQRRDQHAARQHQLDARARRAAAVGRCSATTCRRSCRSSAKAAATRRPSTTCSSSW